MPLILSQHFSAEDRDYQDVEGALYHYPRQYFGRVRPFSSFVYYRPGGAARRRADERHYFGHGVIGEPYPDPNDERLRFVDIIQYAAFGSPVPLRDAFGNYYETGTPSSVPQGQSAVREITDVAYHRILAAADTAVTGVSLLPSTLTTVTYAASAGRWPKDDFRNVDRVPAGAGYVPRSTDPPNVYEAAALQERAREDHQRVLQHIVDRVHERGGACLYNNNVDLLAQFGDERILIEAKSLNDLRDSVDRMRYGIGQLLDYGVRYRAEIGSAKPLLAFGRAPSAETGWIAEVLQENAVGFVCRDGDSLRAMNEAARESRLFAP